MSNQIKTERSFESITFKVTSIKYSSPATGFAAVRGDIEIIKDRPAPSCSNYSFAGILPNLFEGAEITAKGYWEQSKYGLQFHIEEVLPETGATVEGLLAYFRSGLVNGIGPKLSERIIEKFGSDTFKVIENTPQRLGEVEGIGQERIKLIYKAWMENKGVHDVMIFLASHKVSQALATRIYNAYGLESIAVVTANPYRLASEVWGIGFVTADQIATNLGFKKDDPRRLRAGIAYSLLENSKHGHTYALCKKFTVDASGLLKVDPNKVEEALSAMRNENQSLVIFESDRIYPKNLYFAEVSVAKFIRKRLLLPGFLENSGATGEERNAANSTSDSRDPDKPYYFDDKEDTEYFDEPSESSGLDQPSDILWSDDQLKAIDMAMNTRLLVITGGPGTGKTTAVKAIVSQMMEKDLKVLLCAPTGRAAKRLSEATGQQASTIHRLLEINQSGVTKYNLENPLDGDCLIVDEISMVDILLMNRLCEAIPPNMKLILVGDADQLPSIGAGNVLKDILSAKQVAKVRLSVIFRQTEGSEIVRGAHQIISGKFPTCCSSLLGDEATRRDFFFLEASTSNETAQLVVELATKVIPQKFGVSQDDIQVLSPMKKGCCGTIALNKELQSRFNPKAFGETNRPLRIGDRVMQIRNNYFKEVFNGQLGKIQNIDEDTGKHYVNFDNVLIGYSTADLAELILAYASTIHKSQGSEYPVVIIPVVTEHFRMLQRNLLYTAVTRAKMKLFLVGQKKAVFMALANNKQALRLTSLGERINA